MKQATARAAVPRSLSQLPRRASHAHALLTGQLYSCQIIMGGGTWSLPVPWAQRISMSYRTSGRNGKQALPTQPEPQQTRYANRALNLVG